MSAVAGGGDQHLATARTFLDQNGIAWEDGARPGELVLTLPGEQKLRTVCSLVFTRASVSVSAFVIRHPDENEAAFYRYLLAHNLRLPGLAYAVDGSGDVFVTGRLPAGSFDAAQLDSLLGVVLIAADGAFNDLLALGFLSSMRRELAWRRSRGESTANLDAFRHLLDPVLDPGPGFGPAPDTGQPQDT